MLWFADLAALSGSTLNLLFKLVCLFFQVCNRLESQPRVDDR